MLLRIRRVDGSEQLNSHGRSLVKNIVPCCRSLPMFKRGRSLCRGTRTRMYLRLRSTPSPLVRDIFSQHPPVRSTRASPTLPPLSDSYVPCSFAYAWGDEWRGLSSSNRPPARCHVESIQGTQTKRLRCRVSMPRPLLGKWLSRAYILVPSALRNTSYPLPRILKNSRPTFSSIDTHCPFRLLACP